MLDRLNDYLYDHEDTLIVAFVSFALGLVLGAYVLSSGAEPVTSAGISEIIFTFQ